MDYFVNIYPLHLAIGFHSYFC